MDEQTFDDQTIDNFYQENFDNVNLDYFNSQVFSDVQSEITDTNISVTSSTSSLTSNPLWKYYNRNPSDAPGYNVCKIVQLSTK